MAVFTIIHYLTKYRELTLNTFPAAIKLLLDDEWDNHMYFLLGPVVRSMVSANHWLNSIKINRLSWYLTLVSANQASNNSALKGKLDDSVNLESSTKSTFHLHRLTSSHSSLPFSPPQLNLDPSNSTSHLHSLTSSHPSLPFSPPQLNLDTSNFTSHLHSLTSSHPSLPFSPPQLNLDTSNSTSHLHSITSSHPSLHFTSTVTQPRVIQVYL